MPLEPRVLAWSAQLAQTHQTLRAQLRAVRSNLGSRAPDALTLQDHCLSFCTTVTAHHEGEDALLFDELLRVDPSLQSVVTSLKEDHQLIAGLVSNVRRLASEALASSPARLQAIGRELDGLAAIMESHFRYEERRISAALDAGVRDTGWTRQVLG